MDFQLVVQVAGQEIHKSSRSIFEYFGECARNGVLKFQDVLSTIPKNSAVHLFFLFRLQRCKICIDLYGDSGWRVKYVRWKFGLVVSRHIMNNRRG